MRTRLIGSTCIVLGTQLMTRFLGRTMEIPIHYRRLYATYLFLS